MLLPPYRRPLRTTAVNPRLPCRRRSTNTSSAFEARSTRLSVVPSSGRGLVPPPPNTTTAHCRTNNYDVDLPEKTRVKNLERCFAPLKAAQNLYERCEEVDDLNRKHFVNLVRSNSVPAPNADEAALMSKSLGYLLEDSHFKRIAGTLKTFPTVNMFIRRDVEDDVPWGKCCGEVDESLELVFSWFWRWCSYERMDNHRRANGDLIRVTDASDKSRTQTINSEYRVATGIANRCSVQRFVWFGVETSATAAAVAASAGETSSYVIAFEAVPSPTDSQFSPKSVVAPSTGTLLFERVALRVTKVTHVQKTNLGGGIPKWLMDSLLSPRHAIVTVQDKWRRPERFVDKVGWSVVLFTFLYCFV